MPSLKAMASLFIYLFNQIPLNPIKGFRKISRIYFERHSELDSESGFILLIDPEMNSG